MVKGFRDSSRSRNGVGERDNGLAIPIALSDDLILPTDRQAVESWLEQLPLSAPLTCVRRMRDALELLLDSEMDWEPTLTILDRYHRTLLQLFYSNLQRYFVSHSLPLPRQNREALHVTYELCQQLGRGYQRVIGQLARLEPTSARDNRIGEACHASITASTQALLCAYGSYLRLTPGLWREIHHVFEFAFYRDLNQEITPFPEFEGNAWTLEDVYKRVLILGLSDPYQLPFGAMDGLYNAMTDWVHRTRLLLDSEPDPKHSQFLIDTKADLPAIPMLPNFKRNDVSEHLILDTSGLKDHLQRALGESVAGSGHHKALPSMHRFSDFERIEILRTLLTRFGTQPIRRHTRVKGGGSCELIAGLDRVHAIAEILENSSADSPVGAENGMPSSSTGWRVLDESATGIRLTKTGVKDVTLSVGEMVAFRLSAQRSDWVAGIVRWARTDVADGLEIGLYKLGTDMIPATLPGPDGPEPALYLPELDPLKRQPTLIAANGHYRPNAVFTITVAGAELGIRATNLISSSQKFDWFEVADRMTD